MLSVIDTKSATAVAKAVLDTFQEMYPNTPINLIDKLFRDIEDTFCGRNPDYQAIDLKYHDFEHTLQATLCLLRLIEGRHSSRAKPLILARHFELAIAAMLLHDTGYLKLRSDRVGT